MTSKLLELTADVAASYAANNPVSPGDLPAVIRSIYEALERIERGEPEQPETPKLTAGEIRKSIKADALVSFEDGRPYRMLRRHLITRGLTPEQYRAKWGLPGDYPMVAPNYSERRSAMAKAIGLGRTVGGKVAQVAGEAAEVVADAAAEVIEPALKRRGRPAKSSSKTPTEPKPRGRPLIKEAKQTPSAATVD